MTKSISSLSKMWLKILNLENSLFPELQKSLGALSPREFAQGHLQGAAFLPVTALEENVKQLTLLKGKITHHSRNVNCASFRRDSTTIAQKGL
ncbi:MAG: hypothetical protein WA080_07995 [Sulfuricurvum sp.]